MRRVIYDLGANNGDDIPYYLLTAEVVVAVEANPVLCEQITERFAEELRSGRPIVENCVVTADSDPRETDFYIHRTASGLSHLPKPTALNADQLTRVRLPSLPILALISARGEPYYVKIDLENYDAEILNALFRGGVRPPHISAEAHSVEVFALLVGLGRYDSFELVDGNSVSEVYADREIVSDLVNSSIRHSFPRHSAGPFGDDIDGEWMTADNFFRLLALEGLGRKDIHATTTAVADTATVSMVPYWRRRMFKKLGALVAHAGAQLWDRT